VSAGSGEDFFGVNARARVNARRRTVYELRYRGQSHELAVESDSSDPAVLREEFARAHEQRYGYRDDSGEVELVTIRASVWGAAPRLSLRGAAAEDIGGHDDGVSGQVEGPAVYPLPEATLYVPTGWSGKVDEWGTMHLERAPSS
jgi:N-methylhydantoinase A